MYVTYDDVLKILSKKYKGKELLEKAKVCWNKIQKNKIQKNKIQTGGGGDDDDFINSYIGSKELIDILLSSYNNNSIQSVFGRLIEYENSFNDFYFKQNKKMQNILEVLKENKEIYDKKQTCINTTGNASCIMSQTGGNIDDYKQYDIQSIKIEDKIKNDFISTYQKLLKIYNEKIPEINKYINEMKEKIYNEEILINKLYNDIQEKNTELKL